MIYFIALYSWLMTGAGLLFSDLVERVEERFNMSPSQRSE